MVQVPVAGDHREVTVGPVRDGTAESRVSRYQATQGRGNVGGVEGVA